MGLRHFLRGWVAVLRYVPVNSFFSPLVLQRTTANSSNKTGKPAQAGFLT